MAQANREFELKITLDEAQMRRVRGKPAIRAMANGRPTTKTLLSIYHDTPDMALRRAGIALRTRKIGRNWVQTVKAKGEITAGISNHVEIETPVRGSAPSIDAISDAALRQKIREIIGHSPLSPVIETHIKRTARFLAPPTGGLVELCLDDGELRAGGRVAPIREAEIELANGDPAEVFQVAQHIFAGEVLRYSTDSKAALGYRLLAGEDAQPRLEPVFAKAPGLKPAMTAEEAMQAILRSCFEQIAGNLAVAIKTELPEGPHQLRVGLRRLRSALTVFKPLMAMEGVEPISAEAKALGGTVGALRDMDVLISDVVGAAAKAMEAERDPGFKSLTKALVARRDAVKAAVAKGMSAEEAQRLPLALGAFTEGRGWLDPGDIGQSARLAAPVCDFAADQLWRKVSKWGKRLEELTIPERHEMRKELKKLRYTVDFFKSLYPEKKVKPFLKQLKRLQDVFGHLNDAAMAQHELPGIAGGQAEPAFAAGRVIGWCEANAEIAWRDAQRKWADLKAAPDFWR